MEKKIKLLPPMMPNFISIGGPPRPRQEGFQEGIKIRVSQLSVAEAEEYGEMMKQAFIEHHKQHVAREAEQNKA